MKKNLLLTLSFLCFNLVLNSQTWGNFPGPASSDAVSAKMNNNGIILITTRSEVWMSMDKGKAWEKVNTGLVLNQFNTYPKIFVSKSNEFYLSYSNFLYLLDITNKSWQLINSYTSDLETMLFADNGNIYYVSGKQIYLSTTNGMYFSKIFNKNFTILGIADGGLNKKYSIINNSSNKLELYSFNDDGRNIKMLTSVMPGKKLFCKPSNGTLFSVDLHKIYRSTNGTKWTFNTLSNSTSTLSYIEMVFLNDNSIICVTDLGLYKSTDDGLTWTKLPLSIGSLSHTYAQFKIETSITTTNDILILFENSLRLINNLNSYQFLVHSENKANNSYPYTASTGEILLKDYYGTFVSRDSGRSWVILDDSRDNYYVMTSDGTYFQTSKNFRYSTDRAVNWTDIKKPSTKECYPVLNNHKTILLNYEDDAYVSTDLGKNWKQLKSTPSLYSLMLSSNDILYGFNSLSELWYSFDFGTTWTKEILSTNMSSLENVFLSNNNVLYWTEYNFTAQSYYSLDFGKTKLRIPFKIYSTDVDDNDNYIFADALDSTLKILNLFTLQSIYIPMNDIPRKYRNTIFGAVIGYDGYLYLRGDGSGAYKSSKKWFQTTASCLGISYKDIDVNCQLDLFNDILKSFHLNIRDVSTGQSWYTNSTDLGALNLGLFKGTYSLKLEENPILWQACNFPQSFSLNDGDKLNLGNLLVKPLEKCSLLDIDIATSNFRRCFNSNTLFVTVRNSGTEDAINQKLLLNLDQYMINIQSSFFINSQNNNALEYIIPNIPAGGEFQFEVKFEISCAASLGYRHCIDAHLINTKNCQLVKPIPESKSICQVNRGSFDPNDIQAFENGQSIQDYTTQNTPHEYLVRFQNTGTDTAFNIRVLNQLDSNLDWSSFEVSSSSHPYSYVLDDKGLLTIIFRNVLLPDNKVDEPGSNGFFKYRINQKKDLPANTEITNSASIYFDFNLPIITNKLTLKVKIITKIDESELGLKLTAFPNPFKESTTVYFSDLESNNKKIAYIYASDGQAIDIVSTYNNQLLINHSDYESKILFIKVISESGKTGTIKLIKID
ncbi:MAG: hypothetical protein ABI851_14865 [Saprospiraceae bacterium]